MASNPQRLSPLERLRRSGIRPDRALGQNFLIDPNILDVIERTAALATEDVVLEVGPGLGVLTERLLERCGTVHCVELDERLASMLEEEFAGRANLRLHRGDAMRLDLAGLKPAPVKFVANLPYNVAAPLVMKSLGELPSVGLWCLMLQKEIADRLFAAPGSANYGGISVMAQLLAEKLAARTIPPSVFFPRPRVQSSLLAFRRRAGAVAARNKKEDTSQKGGGEGTSHAGGSADHAAYYAAMHFKRVRDVVYACFGHRRKKLVNNLAESGVDLLPASIAAESLAGRKRRLESMLENLGLAAGARAQELKPVQFVSLVETMDEI